MKVLLVILGVLVIGISCGLSVHYHQGAFVAQEELNLERYKRMEMEEALDKAQTRIVSLEEKIEQVIKKEKSMEKLVQQTELINKDLKDQVKGALTLNESLESKVAELTNKLALRAAENVSIEGL